MTESARGASISVVIPVYRGETTLPTVVAELEALREPTASPGGQLFQIDEVVLVWDHGPDRSDRTIRELAEKHSWVRPVWLSRNFGQHAATIAGMGASGGEWIVTMDEDGQHDPAAIGRLVDAAYAERAQLVYAAPGNAPPHGFVRNSASWLAKHAILPILTSREMPAFHSYRLVAGDVGRAVAAYAGPDVFLDIAFGWVTTDVATIEVDMRTEGREAQNYNLRSLFSHFWRLVLSSGNRPLRLVSLFGGLCAIAGLFFAAWLLVAHLTSGPDVAGWTSLAVLVLVIGGITLGSLGIIAEYVGLAASMSMGRPGFVVLEDPDKRFGPSPRSPRP